MFTKLKMSIAAASLAVLAIPASAQEDNDPRTTYAITFYKFNGNGDVRWNEMMNTIMIPARAAVGLPEPQVHWLMGGEWDIITVVEMSEGMAGLDTHGSAADTALTAELVRRAGSEAALEAMTTEMNGLIDESMRIYSHTHP